MKQIVGLLFIVLCHTLYAQNHQKPMDLFLMANDLYKKGQIDSARQCYNRVLEMNYFSADLHYNLGNCYYKLNQIGPAVYHYEKALLMDPRNADIQYNLSLAELKVLDKMQAVPMFPIKRAYHRLLRFFNADHWAKLAVTCAWLMVFCGVTFVLIHNKTLTRLSFSLGLVLVFAMLFCLVFAFHSNQINQYTPSGIILSETAYVYSAPNEEETNLYILHGGHKVKILEHGDQWLLIQLQDGNVGWVPIQNIGIL